MNSNRMTQLPQIYIRDFEGVPPAKDIPPFYVVPYSITSNRLPLSTPLYIHYTRTPLPCNGHMRRDMQSIVHWKVSWKSLRQENCDSGE